jgi:predicted nucleic acid-binding protein
VTATKVVDASAVAAMVLDEPSAASVRSRITEAQLVAPTLLVYEFANVCAMRQRQRSHDREFAITAFSLFLRWDIKLMPVNHLEVVRLVDSSRLSAYDASYLWLARHLGCELVTLDQRLQAAASAIP